MYSSGQGRWLSPDPIGGDITNPQSLNRYAYVTNNPCSLVDSLGLEGCGQDPAAEGFFGASNVRLRPGFGGGGQFGVPRSGGRQHKGIDRSTLPGTPLVPFLGGTVTFVGYDGALGLTVTVDAGGGYTYLYGHLEAAFVSPGQELDANTLIGFSGTTGNAAALPLSEAHVHLQLYGPGNPSPISPTSFMSKPCPSGVKNLQPPANNPKPVGVGGLVGRVSPPNVPGGLIVAISNWAQGLLGWTWIPTASGPTTGGSGSIVTATIQPVPPGCQPGMPGC